jgi:hypothetical protein
MAIEFFKADFYADANPDLAAAGVITSQPVKKF